MHLEVAADRRMAKAGCLQHGGCPQRSGRDHDLACVHDEATHADASRRGRIRDRLAGDGIRNECEALHTGRTTSLEQDPRDPDPRHDPRTRRERPGEVRPDPRLLGPASTPEPATPAVVAPGCVAPRRRRLPAQRFGAAQDRVILGRDECGGHHPHLSLEDRNVLGPRGAVLEPVEAVVAPPFLADGRWRLDRRHPVDERPAADPGAGQQGHRAVPGREEAMVEIQAGERVELVGRHRPLVDEGPCLQDDHRTAGSGELRGHHAATGPRAHDDHVRIEPEGLVGVARIEWEGVRHDRRDAGGDRGPLRPIADRDVARVGAIVARIGIGQERQQLAQTAEHRPPLGDPRTAPVEQIAFAVLLGHLRERRGAGPQRGIGDPRLHRAEDDTQLGDLARIRGALERLDRERCTSLPVVTGARTWSRAQPMSRGRGPSKVSPPILPARRPGRGTVAPRRHRRCGSERAPA